MRIRYTEVADADLDRLLADTTKQWPTSLQRTTRRLRKFEQTVVQFPHAGQRTRFPGIRKFSLIPLPYAAFYKITAEEIIILRLYHTAQRPFDPQGQ